MNDHIKEALERVGPALRPALIIFLQALIDKGPDEEMWHRQFIELVSPSDCADIGWTDETRDLLKHLVSRLEAIGKE